MKLRALAGAVILALTATVSCIPQPVTATTDTLQIDGVGTWSEPANDLYVGFSVNECSVHAPDRTEFYAMAYLPDLGDVVHPSDLVQYFVMRQYEQPAGAVEDYPLPTAGHYSWGLTGPLSTAFDIGGGSDYSAFDRAQFGYLDITEIEFEPAPGFPGMSCIEGWTATRVRATFFVSTPAGGRSGSIRIG